MLRYQSLRVHSVYPLISAPIMEQKQKVMVSSRTQNLYANICLIRHRLRWSQEMHSGTTNASASPILYPCKFAGSYGKMHGSNCTPQGYRPCLNSEMQLWMESRERGLLPSNKEEYPDFIYTGIVLLKSTKYEYTDFIYTGIVNWVNTLTTYVLEYLIG